MNKKMVMELYILKMVVIMRENGSMIKCMDSENFITKMVKLLIKEIGKMMNLTGKVDFIIQIQLVLMNNLTIEIFHN